jgi:hypothetical protein
MKIVTLRKRIALNFTVSLLIIVSASFVIYLYFKNQTETRNKISDLSNKTNAINAEVHELQSKTVEIAKYKESWQKLSENKKNTSGIKIDDFNSRLEETAKKYFVTTKDVKINVPDALRNGIFTRDTIDILFTTVSIKFSAISDTMAMAFIADFVNSLQGYYVVTNVELKKEKDYSAQDLKDIALGKTVGNVEGKLDFFWYVSKESIKTEF